VVPVNIQPQDLQLCASLANGSESCQPLSGGQQGTTIDLTQSSAGGGGAAATTTTPPTQPSPSTETMTPMPAPAPQSYYPPSSDGVAAVFTNIIINPLVETITSAFTVQYADAQLIGIEDTTVSIPITAIVPIDLNIQNAQVCASVLSSGDQSCTQVVLNPEQTSYTDVNVDLSSATPTLTTAEQEPTATTAATTTEPTATTTQTAPTTTTETAPTTTTEPTAPTTTTEPTAPTTTTEPTAPTEEPTTDTGTQEGGTTTEEPTTDTGTQEPTTEGSTSEGGSQ
jgi:hypothetical protein